MPTQRKEQEVALLEEKMKTANGLVFTGYMGLTANEMVELRRELHQHGVEFRVIKNRLAKIAAERAGVQVDAFIQGPTGICFGFDDPAVPFKVASKLSKKFKPYKLNGGVFEGQPIEKQDLARYTNLPTKEEALSRLASVIQAPLQKLASALAGPVRNLSVVLKEASKQK